ncbi:hypothetical protein DUZ99_15245 [Xylanibacillus composti]|nr:hypothetical protein [Xylanibacillus composti]MDT9726337.1 hypothetical protein [Xylanibacillus composti]
MYNSIKLAGLSTIFIILVFVIVAYTSRMLNSAAGIALAKTMTTGYAIPGAIIAIGVLSFFIPAAG